jgi:hypothetical protein
MSKKTFEQLLNESPLLKSQLAYTGHPQFQDDKILVSTPKKVQTTFALGTEWRKFMAKHASPVPVKTHVPSPPLASDKISDQEKEPKWFWVTYTTSRMNEIGLTGCAKYLLSNFKSDVIMKDERNVNVSLFYTNLDRDTIHLTPASVVDSLLYHGAIDYHVGTPFNGTNLVSMFNAHTVKDIACYCMGDMTVRGSSSYYWSVRNLRFDTSNEKFKDGKTQLDLFKEFFGKQGWIPNIVEHKPLWARVLKKTKDLEKVYEEIWPDELLKAQLAYTGNYKFKENEIRIHGKSTYQWGNEWLTMIRSTPCTNPKVLQAWKLATNMNPDRHAKFGYDNRPSLWANAQPKKIGDEFSESLWFERITGMREEQWNDKNFGRKCFERQKDGSFDIVHANGVDRYNTGILHHDTLADLRRAFKKSKKSPKPIMLVNNLDDNTKRTADIRHILINPAHEGHMFQAASQFDALECIQAKRDRADNTFLTDYVHDGTQGPYVSLVCPAAAISRRDLAHIQDDEDAPSQAIKGKNINYLSALGKHRFEVVDGYIVNNTREKTLPENKTERRDLSDQVTIMYNEGASVYMDITDSHAYKMVKRPFKVHQVFVAAMNIAQGGSGMDNSRNDDKANRDDKLRFLLTCAYEATYLAAHKCKAPALWLTLVGGGVFGNPIPLVLEVINEVHQGLGGGLDVYLVDWGGACALDDEQNVVLRQ